MHPLFCVCVCACARGAVLCWLPGYRTNWGASREPLLSEAEFSVQLAALFLSFFFFPSLLHRPYIQLPSHSYFCLDESSYISILRWILCRHFLPSSTCESWRRLSERCRYFSCYCLISAFQPASLLGPRHPFAACLSLALSCYLFVALSPFFII